MEQKKRSLLWNYYEKVTDKFYVARCLICQNEYRYSSTTSNLKKHLVNRHSITFENCQPADKSNNSVDIVYTEYVEADNSQFSFVGQEVEVHGTSEDESKDLLIVSKLKQRNIQNSNHKRKNHSELWNHFLKLPDKDGFAQCLYCNQEYSYKTSGSNLKIHLQRKHMRELNNFNNTKNLPAVWHHFFKLQNKDGIAECLYCGQEYSYKSTRNNLTKHLKFKHKRAYYSLFNHTENSVHNGSVQKYEEDPLSPQMSEGDDEKLIEVSKPVKTLRDCSADRQVTSLTEQLTGLKEPALQHKINPKTPNKSDNSLDIVYMECEEADNSQFSFVGEEVEVHGTSEDESKDLPMVSNIKRKIFENSNNKRKNHSALWNHFLKLPDKNGIAQCLYCAQEYSYKSTGHNLKMHLQRKHLRELNNFNNTRKKLPAIWKHFLKLRDKDGFAECLYCGKEYSYKASGNNLKRHLSFKHKRAYYSLFNHTKNSVQNASVQKYEDPLSPQTSEDDEKLIELSKSVKTPRDGSSDHRQVTSLTKQLIGLKEPGMQHNINPIPIRVLLDKKLMIDNKLLEMIIQDQETFSIVEGEGFRNFVQALNPYYELPTRKMISSTLVPEKFTECKRHVIDLVKNANYLCITIESWISQVKDTYIALTAHFILDYKLNSVMLHCENLSNSYTIDTVAKLLKDIAREYVIEDKITLVVSQNAHYIKEAVEQNEWPSFTCFLQKINLVIEMSIGVIDPIIETVKKIVVYFKNNTEVTQALLKYQTDVENKTLPLRLILSVSTRWTSVFYMLQRFLNLQNAVTSVLEDLTVDLPDISAEMWGTIKQVCIILQPLEEATRAMCGAPYLTGSLAIVIADGLKNVIELMKNKPLTGVAENFFVNVETCLKKYLLNSEVEDNLLLGVCTFLDPRFKMHAFLDNYSEQESTTCESSERVKRAHIIKNHVLELLKHKLKEKQQTITNSNHESDMSQIILIVEEPEPISIWGKINKTIAAATPSQDDISAKAKKEIEMFLNEEVIWRGSCPQEWWKSHEMIYPNLAEIYAEHSHIVVTSVQCERAFSKTGGIFDEKRARLSRKRTPELVFLYSNSHVYT